MGRFSEALTEAYQARMAAKLGLRAYHKGTAVRVTLRVQGRPKGSVSSAPRLSHHRGSIDTVCEVFAKQHALTWPQCKGKRAVSGAISTCRAPLCPGACRRQQNVCPGCYAPAINTLCMPRKCLSMPCNLPSSFEELCSVWAS